MLRDYPNLRKNIISEGCAPWYHLYPVFRDTAMELQTSCVWSSRLVFIDCIIELVSKMTWILTRVLIIHQLYIYIYTIYLYIFIQVHICMLDTVNRLAIILSCTFSFARRFLSKTLSWPAMWLSNSRTENNIYLNASHDVVVVAVVVVVG